MKPSGKFAALYQGSKALLAYPTNQTTAGFCHAAEPFLHVENDATQALGAAVRKALAEYRNDLPAPARDAFKAISQPRWSAARVRSETEFMRGARYVVINEDEAFTLVPHSNRGVVGSMKGFEANVTKAISLPSTADDLALGAACLQALALCE